MQLSSGETHLLMGTTSTTSTQTSAFYLFVLVCSHRQWEDHCLTADIDKFLCSWQRRKPRQLHNVPLPLLLLPQPGCNGNPLLRCLATAQPPSGQAQSLPRPSLTSRARELLVIGQGAFKAGRTTMHQACSASPWQHIHCRMNASQMACYGTSPATDLCSSILTVHRSVYVAPVVCHRRLCLPRAVWSSSSLALLCALCYHASNLVSGLRV